MGGQMKICLRRREFIAGLGGAAAWPLAARGSRAKQRIPGSRTALWRFFERHKLTYKKSLCAAERRRADVARARRRWIRQQGFLDTTRLVFIDETAITTNMVRVRGRCPRGERLVSHVPQGEWKTITFIAGLR
jgi:hypothetical protein